MIESNEYQGESLLQFIILLKDEINQIDGLINAKLENKNKIIKQNSHQWNKFKEMLKDEKIICDHLKQFQVKINNIKKTLTPKGNLDLQKDEEQD